MHPFFHPSKHPSLQNLHQGHLNDFVAETVVPMDLKFNMWHNQTKGLQNETNSVCVGTQDGHQC